MTTLATIVKIMFLVFHAVMSAAKPAIVSSSNEIKFS